MFWSNFIDNNSYIDNNSSIKSLAEFVKSVLLSVKKDYFKKFKRQVVKLADISVPGINYP